MKILTSLLVAGLVLISGGLEAQSPTTRKESFRSGEVLVQARKATLQTVLSDIDPSGTIQIEREISAPMDIWLLTFDPTRFSEYSVLEKLQLDSRIENAQLNHTVSLRDTLPNDAQIGSQWQYVNSGANGGVIDADMDMDEAWDITTGGLTAQGDTIVVCAVDDGIDPSHIDFEDNLWVNYGEIPNNGIDDDSNGYVDDYRGWNITTLDDDIDGGSHGTPVAGIMGAKGNNGIGVSGVSWDVKVMVIKNDFDTDEADVIAAYTYPLVMRRLYNSTNGAEGAFVVATNSSWGIDQGSPSNSPLWCAFYDTLGAAGIISCGATANWNYNVDVDGDLPTACPSDYLISVTNMDKTDNKVQFAGYGATTIDLGAFGDETYTTDLGNTYGGFGGTSGATPHVTGLVGLMYSLDCGDFISTAKSNPPAAALMVKQSILNGVDPNTSLNGITVTGGRVNAFNALQQLLVLCDSTICTQPFSLGVSGITDSSANLEWNSFSDSGFVMRYKSIGEVSWTEVGVNTKTFALTNLKPCMRYEYQVRNGCDSLEEGYSSSKSFTTTGCESCTANSYCDAYSTSSALVHIKKVEINTLSNESGNDNGYIGNLYATTTLTANQTYTLSVTPGYNGFSYETFLSVWVDFDQDGNFFATNELLYQSPDKFSGTKTVTVQIPEEIKPGITRMRVMLKYQSAPSSSCEIIGMGEVEDYCIQLADNTGINTEWDNDWVSVYPNPFTNQLRLTLSNETQGVSEVFLEDVTGRVLYSGNYHSRNIHIELPDNLSKGVYFVKVRSGSRLFRTKVLKD